MTQSVFVLTETNGQTGFPLGVFAELEPAIDAAKSWARRRAQLCSAADKKTFGADQEPGAYELSTTRDDSNADISIIHTPSGDTPCAGPCAVSTSYRAQP